MRKITNFIVNKRNIILVLFIILTIISAILANKVNINYDMAEYLPSTSETRQGMDIMEENFKEIKSSDLNVMFKGLADEQKSEILEYLKSIEGVSSVDYDNTEDYNKEDYTLFVITVDDFEDSEVAGNVYNDITEHFEDYELYTSGAIAERNAPILPMWIMVLAVGCMMIILTIMCDSYVEPILFLIAILMAVILNKGTNIIFSSVSNITDSIVAILQMALSMDYSIMLMDRYRQEKEKEPDKVKAMKNALYHAFKAISSSSVTTIVGLLALVFMSFTFGRDMGLVLAKGVLFSLICIFFVLPSLILMCDNLITKTAKKVPNIRLNKLGKISHKLRYVAIIVFIVIFAGSYLLKGNLEILYTAFQQDKISEVFDKNNQIALIYKSEDEEKIAQYLSKIEENDKVKELLGYGNTINEELTYNELNQKINDLGSNMEIEDYLFKILYYNYYNPDENNTMTFNEFTSFIKNQVYNNPEMSDELDENTRKDIDRLENFIQTDLINKERTSAEIASILEIDEEQVKDIFTYYMSKNNNTQISLSEFINFINNDVLTNEKYASSIDDNAKNSLITLAKFTDKNTITKKMTSTEMANLFGIDEATMNSLYTYYVSVSDIDTKLSISEFSNFVLTDVVTNPQYSNIFDETTISSMKLLATFSNKDVITKEMNYSELANLFAMDKNVAKQLLLLKYSTTDNGTALTLAGFINTTIYLKNNTPYLAGVDISVLETLLMDDSVLANPNKYTATEMSQILGMPANQMYQIYALIDFSQNNTSNWKMSPNNFVAFILENSDNESIKSNLDENTAGMLNLASGIMASTINNASYSYEELAQLIGIDESTTKSIYTLYVAKNTTTKLTPQEFVTFVLNHKNDEILAGSIDANTISQLSLLQNVMNGTINNKKYSSEELSNLLGMNKSDLSLLYGLYTVTYVDTNPSLSLKDFINFLLDDVIQNPDFSSKFDENTTAQLKTINEVMNNSINKTQYNKENMFTILNKLGGSLDKDTIDLLYMYYGSCKEYNENWTLTVENLINFLKDNILTDSRFDNFMDDDMRQNIEDSKNTVNDAKELLIGGEYSRLIINTTLASESEETFNFIQKIKDDLGEEVSEFYIIGDSPMAYEMSKTFPDELNFITILTMLAIFVVVAFTFKSAIIPLILVLIIQSAVYTTMGILSFSGEGVYFIALLIVQSILMGATIDYAILYTTYYIEHRKTMDVKESIINSYNRSVNTILTSSSILIIATFVLGICTSGIISQICKVISQGTLCAVLLILILLPAVMAACDKLIIRKK